MARTVKVSKTAEKKLRNLLNYLEDEWSKNAQLKFIKKFEQAVKIISSHPETFPKSPSHKTLRRCVITKQTTIFFKFNATTVNIIALFDTRQNPDNKKEF